MHGGGFVHRVKILGAGSIGNHLAHAARVLGWEVTLCDIDPAAESIARRHFAESPHGSKIRIHMGPALQTIEKLAGPFDLVFIDADKENYPNYYEPVLARLRPGGLIVVDNTLWSGEVVAPRDEAGRAIHELNETIQHDPRVENVLATIRDGIHIARKLEP